MKFNPLALIVLVLTFGCKNQPNVHNTDPAVDKDPFVNCKYGSPKPIFEEALSAVKMHQFQINGMEGIEEIEFEDSLGLTLIQSGCDAIRQEFRFRIPGSDFTGHENGFWISQCVGLLNFLATVDDRYASFYMWGQSIQEMASGIQLGEPVEVQPGFFAEIDKILASDHAILLLILSEGQ